MTDDIASLINEIQTNPGDEPMTREQFTTIRDRLRAAVPLDVRRVVIDRMQRKTAALVGLMHRRAW